MLTDAASSQARPVVAAARRFAPFALVLAVVIVHLWIAALSVGPMYLFDEVGYLAGADVISGSSDTFSLCGSSYAVGYSALLAPLWWLPITPLAVYQVAVIVSALIGAAVMWPASVLARFVGVPRGAALLIGAVVTLVPARALLDNYVIAENPLALLVVTACVYAIRIARTSHAALADYVAFGVLVGAAGAVHARAYPFVVVAVVWLVFRGTLHTATRVQVIAASIPAVALTVTGYLGMRAIGGRIFPDDSRTDDLFAGTTPGRLAEVVAGQAFTHVASWSIVGLLGMGALAVHVWQRWRNERLTAVTGFSAFLLLATVVMAASIVVLLASSSEYAQRLDIPLFGRYLDPFIVPVAVVGLSAYVLRGRRRLVTHAMLASAAAIVVYATTVLPRVSPTATWIPFAVPGLEPIMDPHTGDDRPTLAVAACIALAVAAAVWMLRRRALAVVACATVFAAAVTVYADMQRVDPFEADLRAESVMTSFVWDQSNMSTGIAVGELNCAERNKLQFELAGRVHVASAQAKDDLLIGPAPDWDAVRERGYRRVAFTMWLGAAVWMSPQAAANYADTAS